MRPQFQIKTAKLVALVTTLLLTLSFPFYYFVSWQIGIPTFIFGLFLTLLYRLTICFKKFDFLFLFILGLTFSFTVYPPIHEAIHLLFAYVSGVPVSKIVWWFLTDSGIQTPYVLIPATSRNVLLEITPFLLLTVAFITLWYIWYIRKSIWTHFAYVPLAFNVAYSNEDLHLSPIVALALSLIFLAPCFYRFFKLFKNIKNIKHEPK